MELSLVKFFFKFFYCVTSVVWPNIGLFTPQLRYFSSVAATTGRKRRLSNNMSGSETGSEHGRGGHGGGGGAGDLASRTLVLESKRFYLDVKENSRGRFIKIAEISADGRKNQILMTLPTAAQFRQHLVAMIQAVRWALIHWRCCISSSLFFDFVHD